LKVLVPGLTGVLNMPKYALLIEPCFL